LNSHILQEVEMICDRVAILSKGKLRATGTIPELIDSYSHGKRLRVHFKCRTMDPQASLLIQNWTFDDSVLALHAQSDSKAVDAHSTTPIDFELQLETSQQRHVDHLVDRLRMANVSLLSLERHRVRLEDVFMAIVDDGDVAA
jgi:ABC-2 type transport system ATP-binding protein